jgi:hypothetical protein
MSSERLQRYVESQVPLDDITVGHITRLLSGPVEENYDPREVFAQQRERREEMAFALSSPTEFMRCLAGLESAMEDLWIKYFGNSTSPEPSREFWYRVIGHSKGQKDELIHRMEEWGFSRKHIDNALKLFVKHHLTRKSLAA